MLRYGVKTIWAAALASTAMLSGEGWAQTPPTGDEISRDAADPAAHDATPVDPDDDKPIIPDAEFDAAIPELSDDVSAPLEPIEAFERADADAAKAGEAPMGSPAAAAEIGQDFPPVGPEAPEFAEPLTPLDQFQVTPVEVAGVEPTPPARIRYSTSVEGLKAVGLDDMFRDLSALEQGNGSASNAAMVAARAREDEGLAVRLMQSRGYYDGTAVSTLEQNPANSGRLKAVLTASPGERYRLGSVTIDAPPVEPADLITGALPLKPGDPIEAERVQGAEANVSLVLPQRGYPFAKLGQRDILLDDATHLGDYTLPVDTGPRASFGGYTTEPADPGSKLAFGAHHVGVLARFKRGELYDSRKVDDLRQALIATSLFSTVSVEPVRTGETAPDGTEYVTLNVRQDAGPPRTLAIEGGYSTGQGLRVEGTWTHRNLFKPEGALILGLIGGTQEQGASATFRRSNAGKRDRTVQLNLSANHSDFDAYESFTGTLAGRISYDSTPIWQKRWTYFYGAEIVGSNEDRYNFALGKRDRGTWLIAALPAFVGFDTSDDLLNPTRGFRIKANVSPETSVRGAARPYARLMLEGDVYYPVMSDLVIAARARVGSIPGIARDDLPPSRRFYAGGGGSVRGFGYQDLGPRSPDDRPLGGRSFNEFSLEARYRFGNFGVVPFVDAGQAYESIYPQGKNLRFGAGIGGRFYTNFGPLRVDVATPIAKKKNEPRIALYISIGQAF